MANGESRQLGGLDSVDVDGSVFVPEDVYG